MASRFALVLMMALAGSAFAGGPYWNNRECLEFLDWYEFNGACYKMLKDASALLDHDGSNELCKTVGPIIYGGTEGNTYLTKLADIHSEEENEFVATTIADGSRAWIGAVRNDETGEFNWMSEDPGSNGGLAYTNWKRGEPNDTGDDEDCVEINRGPTGKWNDLKCKRLRQGICKYTLADVPSDW